MMKNHPLSGYAAVLLGTVFLTTGSLDADEPFAPKLFAFQNGVHFSTPNKRIEVLKELGYDGIGSANLNDLRSRWAEYRKQGLKIYSIYSGVTIQNDRFTVPPKLLQAIGDLKGTDTVVELFVGGKGSDEQAVMAVREVAAAAEKSMLKIVLYPHSGCHIDHLADAVRIARKVDRKNVGVMFNLCHFLMVEPDSDLKKELRAAKPWLWRVSICGAETGTRSFSTLIQPLDRGDFPQLDLLKLLREQDFRGPIGLQCYGVKGDARQNLQHSVNEWKKLMSELQRFP